MTVVTSVRMDWLVASNICGCEDTRIAVGVGAAGIVDEVVIDMGRREGDGADGAE